MAPDQAQQTVLMVRTFMDRVHLATAGQMPEVVQDAAGTLGWAAELYVVDYEQRLLVHAPAGRGPARRPLRIESTLAGRCFRTVDPVPSPSERLLWLPVVDGADRLGVLQIRVPEGTDLGDRAFRERSVLLAHLTGHLIAAKRPYGDSLDRLMRLRSRTMASELLYQLLPPLTFACDGLVISGLLQPAYDVAADAFDYAVLHSTAHLAVLDATGHDLAGTLLAAVALTGYRNSRRNGHGLGESARVMDELVAAHGGSERLATGILAELDLVSGRLRYLNAGHPPPLLMRDGRVVKPLDRGRRMLFGLDDAPAGVAEEQLQRGDRIVFYTDGITEARDQGGTFFGVDRLVDRLQRAAARRQPAPETLRRISHDVLDHQGGILQDDATLLIAEWGTGEEETLAAWGGSARTPHPSRVGRRSGRRSEHPPGAVTEGGPPS